MYLEMTTNSLHQGLISLYLLLLFHGKIGCTTGNRCGVGTDRWQIKWKKVFEPHIAFVLQTYLFFMQHSLSRHTLTKCKFMHDRYF